MYKLPPLYKPIEVTPIPDCVYKMKKISDHFNNENASNCDASVVHIEDAELVELEKRWTEITSRLEKLQSEITAYKSISSGTVTATVPPATQGFQDLVITASPARPPHSLPLIKQQLEKLGMSVFATTYVHSTLAVDKLVTDELRNFIQSDRRVARSRAELAITLVWRKEKDDEPTLMVSPAKQAAPVKGEANIVRYLVRSVPRLLDYESDALRAARLDELLELTISTRPLGAGGSKKDRAAALQSIEQTLAKSQQQSLDGGNELSAVDFVLYSAIVNSKPVDKELGPKTKAWMARCKPAVN